MRVLAFHFQWSYCHISGVLCPSHTVNVIRSAKLSKYSWWYLCPKRSLWERSQANSRLKSRDISPYVARPNSIQQTGIWSTCFSISTVSIWTLATMSKSTGSGGTDNNGSACSICQKSEHESTKCPKRRGCGRCGIPTTHRTWSKECKAQTQSYPRFNEQVCDECLGDHTHSMCNDKLRSSCGVCGHGDHYSTSSNKRLLTADQADFVNIPDSIIDQFTAPYRDKYLQAKEEASASTSRGSPSNSSSRPAVSLHDRTIPSRSHLPKARQENLQSKKTILLQLGARNGKKLNWILLQYQKVRWRKKARW